MRQELADAIDESWYEGSGKFTEGYGTNTMERIQGCCDPLGPTKKPPKKFCFVTINFEPPSKN